MNRKLKSLLAMICVLALTLTMSVCAFAADEVTDDEVANYKSAAETLISQIAGFSDEEIETYLAQNDAFTTATMESWKGVKDELGAYSSIVSQNVEKDGDVVTISTVAQFEKAKADLEEKGLGDHVIVLNESSATVAEAAHALGVEPASIAKTLSVLQGEKPVLIVTEGTAKLDNHKYKSMFHIKAKMIPYDEVEAYVGHAPGGVCPFGVNEGVAVYLDESLRKFDTVYPAAGNGHTAVKLTLQELEAAAGAEGWVDVCKEPEGE